MKKFLEKLNDLFWKSPVGQSIEDTSAQTEKWAKTQLTLLAGIFAGIVLLVVQSFRKR